MIKVITSLAYLRQKSMEVTLEEAPKIICALENVLSNYSNGIGLSAVQIGILKRISIIRIGDKKIDLINPKIIKKEERFRMLNEGCLSLPGLRLDTVRYNFIILESNGQRFVAEGLEACAIQHECEHMDGILILDKKWKKRK